VFRRSAAWHSLLIPREPAFQVYDEAPVAYEPDAEVLVCVDAATNEARFVIVHPPLGSNTCGGKHRSIHDASGVVTRAC
jgi:hypothetical protein